MDQITAHRRGRTSLGMPSFPDVAARTVTTPATPPVDQGTQ
jgi:hypothetical protein